MQNSTSATENDIEISQKYKNRARKWLMPAILVTQEAEIRRIAVKASLGK
jgi:hypothetical protein